MKLSEIKGKRAFEVLEQIPDLIQPIIDDPAANELFSNREKPKGMSNTEFGLRWLDGALSKLIVPHRCEFAALMASINGTTPDEYLENSSLHEMTEDVIGLFSDEVFTAIFFSRKPKTEARSGSVTANIADVENHARL